MAAEFISIHPETPEQRKIAQVVKVLQKGGIIAYPTDSVYNFGCTLDNKRAIEKLAKLKDVKLKKANFSLVCHDLKSIDEYTAPFSRSIFKALNKNLPGPFTFILNASNKIPKLFDNNKKEIGIRIPDNNITLELVEMLGVPLVTTSIHNEDEMIEYITDPEQIFNNYKNQVDLVIDGGIGNNEPSTVIDCTKDDLEILRQGIGELEY
ncbi:MAG: L-threonylcarbamoyladenylate synthase [Flavobacteriales bacterium]|jgi:tRNA threonylcarbamoyl adenosine modification protein (Sua5/YciO/YrdC/YwlC family)|tara:strand:- start:728 stop:1351 length:624 start_codon:yes stop_codon:yes gene_type:complete